MLHRPDGLLGKQCTCADWVPRGNSAHMFTGFPEGTVHMFGKPGADEGDRGTCVRKALKRTTTTSFNNASVFASMPACTCN